MTYKKKFHYNITDSLPQYGDGIFETMLGVNHVIHQWSYHWERLKMSCHRLQINLPEQGFLYRDLQYALEKDGHDFSVVKMVISRGEGLRGYRSIPQQQSFINFTISPYDFPQNYYKGLRLRLCTTRLASQPLLAGMKHCNRLEYVMARRETADGEFDEGLLLDYDNHLIEGLISNLFIMNGRRIITPPLDKAGVCGTMRAYLLDLLPQKGYEIIISPILYADLKKAKAIFLTNALNGIMPVLSIQGINKQFSVEVVNKIRTLTEHPSTW